MNNKHIGFLHPGSMGISLAVAAQNTGHTAYWVSEGRSRSTRERAESNNLVETQTIDELCDKCSVELLRNKAKKRKDRLRYGRWEG